MVVAVVAMAVAADVVLWVVAPVPDPYAQFEKLRPQINQYIRLEYPRDYAVNTVCEDDLAGMNHENRFTTNNMGFRGPELVTPRPADEFRVFLVGGSTTECFYLDDDDELGAVLDGALAPRVAVYNVGLSGAASDDHVAMIGQRLVHLEPDLIVVFAGINDLTRSIYDYDYLHYVETRPAYRKPWYKRAILTSQIARRLYFLRRRLDPSDRELLEERRLESNYAAKIGLQRTVPEVNTPPRTDPGPYRRNLETIVGMAESHGYALAFMTQATTWNSTVDPEARRRSWMRCRRGVTYREDTMDAAMEQLNDVMRSVAGDFAVPLCDLAAELPKSLEYMYDDCHFNIHGARTAGEMLAGTLVENGLAPAGREAQ
jgi:lysophospholipase L1-like esterase